MGKAEDRVAAQLAQEAKDREELHKRLGQEVEGKIKALLPTFAKNIEALDYPGSSVHFIFDRDMIEVEGKKRAAWRLIRRHDTNENLYVLADGVLVYGDYKDFRIVQPGEVWDLYQSYRVDREGLQRLEDMARFAS
jgi:hypothetical protein